MLKLPIKVVLSILILTLSSVVWGKHLSAQKNQPEVSLSPPFEGKGWGIQVQIGVNVSVSNSYSLPLLPGLPFGQIEQAGCVPIPLPLPIFQLGIHSFGGGITQTSCMPIQVAPEPEPPTPAPKPSKIQSQQIVELSNKEPGCHLTTHYHQEKHSKWDGFFRKNPSCNYNFIKTNQNVYYPGDTMQIGVEVEFLRYLKTVAKRKVDTYVLVAPPEGNIIVIPVQIPKIGKWYKLIELARLDTSNFAEGSYQIALVLTEPGGKPINVAHWSHDFQSLISSTRVKIRRGYQYDAEDSNGDGMIDGDFNRDGFCEVSTSFHRRRGNHVWGKPACKKELIFSNQHVYYQGDTISLCLEPGTLQTITKSKADASLLIAPPQGDIIVMPAPMDEIDELCPFLELDNLDTSAFALGNYQIALVLTKPNSNDALNLNNWYDGFRGLVSVARIKFSAGCDLEDIDGDREIDEDMDGDGFSDEEPFEVEEDELFEEDELLEDDKPSDTVTEEPNDNSSDNQDDKPVDEEADKEPVKTPIKSLEQPIWPIEPITLPENKPVEEKPVEEKPVKEELVEEPVEKPVKNTVTETPVVADEEQPGLDDDESVENDFESEEEYDEEGRFEEEGVFQKDFEEGEFYEGKFEE